MLLFPRVLWNVVHSLSSFIMYNHLLIINSSIVFPLLLFLVSCQAVDLALLSAAIISPFPLVNSSILSIFSSPLSISSVMSKYMLAAWNLEPLYSSSRSTQSESDNCVMRTASIYLLLITTAAVLVSLWEV